MINNVKGLVQTAFLNLKLGYKKDPETVHLIALAVITALFIVLLVPCSSSDYNAYIQTHHGQAVISLLGATALATGLLIYVAFNYAKLKYLDNYPGVPLEFAEKGLQKRVLFIAALSMVLIAAAFTVPYLLSSSDSPYRLFMNDSGNQIKLLAGGIGLTVALGLLFLMLSADICRRNKIVFAEIQKRMQAPPAPLSQSATSSS